MSGAGFENEAHQAPSGGPARPGACCCGCCCGVCSGGSGAAAAGATVAASGTLERGCALAALLSHPAAAGCCQAGCCCCCCWRCAPWLASPANAARPPWKGLCCAEPPCWRPCGKRHTRPLCQVAERTDGNSAQHGMQVRKCSYIALQDTDMADCSIISTPSHQGKLDTCLPRQWGHGHMFANAHRLVGGQRLDGRQPRVAPQAVQLRGGQPRHAAAAGGGAAVAQPCSAAAADGHLPGSIAARHSCAPKAAKAAADLCVSSECEAGQVHRIRNQHPR